VGVCQWITWQCENFREQKWTATS